MLAAGQPADDCGRYRAPDRELQPCEFQRDERADILDAADRRPAGRLGTEAIRFSARPSLGGRALVVEIVRRGRGDVEGRLFTFIGHPRSRWEAEDETRLSLTEAQYWQLATQADAALATYGPPVADPDNGETIVCTDGPGFLTERVSHGSVRTLVGSCPPDMTAVHANTIIAAAIQDVLCRQREPIAARTYWNGRRCYQPLLTMAQWLERHRGANPQ